MNLTKCLFLQLLLLLLYAFDHAFGITITNTPLSRIDTPNSILDHKENYKPLFIGNRKRYATSTGVAWFHNNFLAILNLYGEKINTYRYCEKTNQFIHFQEITNTHQTELSGPENLAVSPDGELLAICSIPPHSGIKIYRINKDSHLIDPKPIARQAIQELIHNVRFSPNGKYVATAGWNKKTAICIYKINKVSDHINLELVYSMPNNHELLVPKGINFTKDGKFALIAFSPNVGGKKKKLPDGDLLVYKFDATTGSLGELVCKYSDEKRDLKLFSEDILLIDDDHTIITTDQSSDRLFLVPFNPITGQLGKNVTNFMGPETCLSFPHGISLKPDGNMLAVSNYGTDTVTVYAVQQRITQPPQNL